MGATEILYGGRWHSPAGGQSFAVLNPSDGGELVRVARGGEEDVVRAVAAARASLEGAWGRMGAAGRGRLLSRLAAVIGDNAEDPAALHGFSQLKTVAIHHG